MSIKIKEVFAVLSPVDLVTIQVPKQEEEEEQQQEEELEEEEGEEEVAVQLQRPVKVPRRM